MDRRIIRSRKMILAAYEKLLAVKAPSKITVEEILDEANVGRSTFYAHFDTKDALMSEMLVDIFKHTMNVENAESGHDFQGKVGVSEQMTHILYHLQDQKERLAPLFDGKNADMFWSALKSQLEPIVQSSLDHWRTKRNSQVPDALLVAHVASTYIEVARWWFAENADASPQWIENIFEDLV